ncbi:hypothetical protein GH714_035013 [Hevea brasiliensis]|uniref:Protein kinase domain-containing protein n=1 Tax=Hevea brasiliensis TaxID=3981 RepID=A0A6A6NCD6_HEVBR|nr:hypothetical protein GH714_035013 [Hevea brasiliensis]
MPLPMTHSANTRLVFLELVGYADPEYGNIQKVSEKSDVYSFSVVLLQLISGRKPLDDKDLDIVTWARTQIEEALDNGEYTALIDSIRQSYDEQKIKQIIVALIDFKLEKSYDEEQIKRMIFCAIACTNRHSKYRPQMRKDDAAAVAQKLQLSGWIPQLILSSDATRSRETLKIIQEQVPDLLDADVHFISSFYSIASMDGQTAEHLQQAIQQAVCRYSCDEIHTVMCVGHNRAWEEAASMFTGASVELQTCNAALLEATGKSWEQAFLLAGLGRWKLQGVVKLDNKL